MRGRQVKQMVEGIIESLKELKGGKQVRSVAHAPPGDVAGAECVSTLPLSLSLAHTRSCSLSLSLSLSADLHSRHSHSPHPQPPRVAHTRANPPRNIQQAFLALCSKGALSPAPPPAIQHRSSTPYVGPVL